MSNKYPILQIKQQYYKDKNDEPLGTKSKFWFKHPELGDCLYKYNRIIDKNANIIAGEDWAEKIASELAKLLRLPHAKYELATTWEEKLGIVSVNFVPPGGALIHGNEILATLIPDYPVFATYKLSQYQINKVFEAIKINQVQLPPSTKLPLGINYATDLFIGYLLLDVWIGNGDRHHENWGFIRQRKNNNTTLYLAPTYDHASSLGRELTDQKRISKINQVEAYAKKCTSAFYLNIEDKKPMKTLELFSQVAQTYPHSTNIWLEVLENISDRDIQSILEAFPSERLSPIAAEFAHKILLFNRQRLLSLKT